MELVNNERKDVVQFQSKSYHGLCLILQLVKMGLTIITSCNAAGHLVDQ